MSTDPSNTGVPNEGPSINTDADADADASLARRASTSRRSRRKKDDDSAQPPKPKKEKVKEPKEPKEPKNKDKDKAARAPRRPREKSDATPSSRKKPKLETSGEAPPGLGHPPGSAPSENQHQHHDHHQSQIIPSVPESSKPAPSPSYTQSLHLPQVAPNSNSQQTQPYSSHPLPQPPPPHPIQAAPQRTSGQNYDPIRSAFDNPSPAPAYSPRAASPLPSYRASASPAISSIIDPPGQQQPHTYAPLPRSSSGNASTVSSPAPPAMASTSTHHSLVPSPVPASPARGAPHAPQHLSPSNGPAQYMSSNQLLPQSQPPKLELSPPASKQQQQPAPQQQPQPKPQPQPQQQTERPVHTATPQEPVKPVSDAMEIDSKEQSAATGKNEKGSGTAPSSKAPSPKPARAAKEAPPLPQGSGLITNALFGGVDDSKSSDGPSTPNIIVHIPLQKGNQIVNFAQLAEERYGFAALHPRLAAQKERLARVAAAGAALERNDKSKGVSAGESADEDLSLDMDRDSDVEADITIGGMGAESNGASSQATQGKRKRRKKVEEYDRDDPFVDDSEMAWQEQAAASKDGFFVYSGPLVPEGEKVSVERADGTIKRGRGRGRGGGRGRSLASQSHVPIAAAVPISQDTGLPVRGPGSRGGTSRRARTTKKAAEGDKGTPERNGSIASAARGGGGSNRGGSHAGTRGGKSAPAGSSMMSMMDLAPTPPSKSPNPPTNANHNLAPAPATSPLAKAGLMMK